MNLITFISSIKNKAGLSAHEKAGGNDPESMSRSRARLGISLSRARTSPGSCVGSSRLVLMLLGALPVCRQLCPNEENLALPKALCCTEWLILRCLISTLLVELFMSEMMKIPFPPLWAHKKCGEVTKIPAWAPGSCGLPLSRACLAPPSIFSPDSPAHACQDGALTPAEAGSRVWAPCGPEHSL